MKEIVGLKAPKEKNLSDVMIQGVKFCPHCHQEILMITCGAFKTPFPAASSLETFLGDGWEPIYEGSDDG